MAFWICCKSCQEPIEITEDHICPHCGHSNGVAPSGDSPFRLPDGDLDTGDEDLGDEDDGDEDDGDERSSPFRLPDDGDSGDEDHGDEDDGDEDDVDQDRMIEHFLSSGMPDKAVEYCIQWGIWDRAREIVDEAGLNWSDFYE